MHKSPYIQEAFALADRKDTDQVSVLRDLLGIDTTNRPGAGYERMVDYLDFRFRRLGFRNQRIVVPEAKWQSVPLPLDGPRVNLVCRRHVGPDREEITITAHMDTVPVAEGWRFDPWCGPIELGRIYGRGVADAKGAIASLIVAFEVFGQVRREPHYNITLCLTTDDEVGGYPGQLELARRGFFKGHVLCLEGSQEPEEFLAVAGMVDVKIIAKGIACRTGVNFLGINAVEEMPPVIEELMRLKRDVESRVTDIPAPTYRGRGPGVMTPTFTLSVIQGGDESNVVPGECTLIVNRRYTPGETEAGVTAEILTAMERGRARSRAVEITAQVIPGFPSFRCSLDNPHARRLRDAKKLVLGYQDEDFRQVASARSYGLGLVQQEMGLSDSHFTGVSRAEAMESDTDESCRLFDLFNLTKELVCHLSA